jgi:hypothetical protein
MPESSLRILNACGRYMIRSFENTWHATLSMATLFLTTGCGYGVLEHLAGY